MELVPATSVVRATWRSLLQPRRLVPVAAVAVPLLLAQARWSADDRAVPLALSFLLLIGVLLTADAFGQHISRGYVYFAMAFSLLVELLNLRLRKRASRKRAI